MLFGGALWLILAEERQGDFPWAIGETTLYQTRFESWQFVAAGLVLLAPGLYLLGWL